MCLRQPGQPDLFAEVSYPPPLPGSVRYPPPALVGHASPQILLRLCCTSDIPRIISQLALPLQQRQPFLLVHVSTDFAHAKPVLQRLQIQRTLPFVEELFDQRQPMLAPVMESAEIAAAAEDVDMTAAETAALQCALMQRVTLVQAVPGTAKTCLLVAAARAFIAAGPLMFVCRTNRERDKFLLAILKAGVLLDDIVLVSGRSGHAHLQARMLSQPSEQDTQPELPPGGELRVVEIQS